MLVMFLVVGLFENTLVRPVVFLLAIFLGLGMNVTWRGPRPSSALRPRPDESPRAARRRLQNVVGVRHIGLPGGDLCYRYFNRMPVQCWFARGRRDRLIRRGRSAGCPEMRTWRACSVMKETF